MQSTFQPTSFARLSPGAARIVLAVTIAITLLFVAISLSPRAIGFADKPHTGGGDVDLYVAEIDRIAQGENYYAAADRELHERNYPTRSVFNWRTPLPMWLLGMLRSEPARRTLIGALAGLLLAWGTVVAAREGGKLAGLLGGILLAGALMPCWLERVYVLPVIWAGLFIGLSLCAFATDCRRAGLLLGLSALFLRELAAPYVAISLLLAAKERRWREATGWAIGMLLFFGFYYWHAMQVMAHVRPEDRAHAASWLQFGGAAFVIAISQMNAFFLLLPQWLTAIYLPLVLLGFAGWNTETGRRAGLAACGFVLLFAFVGQPFNQYWGSLVAPLFCFGAARSPAAIADLVRCCRVETLSHWERAG
ncbi:MAG TPA: hypothetical protein VGJ15_09035 [Pirellulales bacterium]|jgi:hypothetical protein